MRMTMAVFFLAGALATAQDPLKVASSHYRLIAESENVRLLEATLAPGTKTAMHSHPALMAVMLQVGATKWTMPDGKSELSPPDMKRGSVTAMPAQSHISENLGKTPLKAVLIEFKKSAPAAGKARKSTMMSDCKLLAESAYATAQLCGGAPGSSVEKHTHGADVIYVALTDLTAEITGADGKKRTLEMKRDVASIAPPETHSALNTGKNRYELIVVDLK